MGVLPDYSPETLPVVDRYIELSRDAVKERPELEPLIIRAVGAYLGEVIRQHIGGFWCRSGPDITRWLIGSELVFMAVNPAGMAAEALACSDEHAGPSSSLKLAPGDQALVEERLAALPPVDESEYYLLSTRFEVTTLAFETLRQSALRSKTEATRYEPEDYEDE